MAPRRGRRCAHKQIRRLVGYTVLETDPYGTASCSSRSSSSSSSELDEEDKLQRIVDFFDEDEDGCLNFTESLGLRGRVFPTRPFDARDYQRACKLTDCPPHEGLDFDAVGTLLRKLGSVDVAYAAVAHAFELGEQATGGEREGPQTLDPPKGEPDAAFVQQHPAAGPVASAGAHIAEKRVAADTFPRPGTRRSSAPRGR